MLDILIATIPKFSPMAPTPGPALLKSVLQQEGFSCKCVDWNVDLWHHTQDILVMWENDAIKFNTDESQRFEDWCENYFPDIINQWIDQVELLKPKYLGLSVFSLKSDFFIRKICEYVRKRLPKQKIIIGGPYVTYIGKELFEKQLIDYAIYGEGEYALLNLMKGNFDYPGINSDPVTIDDLDSLPLPDYDDFDFSLYASYELPPYDMTKTGTGLKMLPVTGSRGCVRNCTFCDVAYLWPKYRFRSGENIAKELAMYYTKYGIKNFDFTDSLLNGSMKAFRDLCQTLVVYYENHKIPKLNWRGQFICRSKNQMTEDDYILMEKAGCQFVHIGIESGSESVRNHMRKKFTNDDIDFTIEQCHKHGIETTFLMMVGYPTETEVDFQATLDMFSKYAKLKYNEPAVGRKRASIRLVTFALSTNILIGTPLYNEYVVEKKLINLNDSLDWTFRPIGGPVNKLRTRLERFFRLADHLQKLKYNLRLRETDEAEEIYKKVLEGDSAFLNDEERKQYLKWLPKRTIDEIKKIDH